MKKIQDIFRLLAARFSDESTETLQPQDARSKPGGIAGPDCGDDASSSSTVGQRPSDAAGILWCSAQHF